VKLISPKPNRGSPSIPRRRRSYGAGDEPGLAGQLSKYSEALELMWFQYVVGYDKQEQHSLATSLRSRLVDFGVGQPHVGSRCATLPSLVSLVLPALLAFGAVFMAVVLTGRVRRLGGGAA